MKEVTSSVRSSRVNGRDSLTDLLRKTPEEARRKEEYFSAKTEAHKSVSSRQNALRLAEELEKYINMEARLLEIGDKGDNPRLAYVRRKIRNLMEKDVKDAKRSALESIQE